MNFVEPIRDRKKIAQIKNQLRGQRRYRDLLLFVGGINTALRISDLLELQVGHFMDDHQHIKPRFWIKEQKRGKRQEVVVNASIREALESLLLLILKSSVIKTISSSSIQKAVILHSQSSVVKPGRSLRLFANRWDCVATLAHTVCEKPGDTTLVCKVWI
jgi:integrase